MTCSWQATDTVPPLTVQVVTTVAAGCGSVVKGAEDAEVLVAVTDVEVDGSSDSDVVSGDGVSVVGDGVVAWVGIAEVVGVCVAFAACSLSETWGAERMFVDAPSLKTATARHTTKLVTAVARIHDAAATPAIRRRDLFSTRQF